MPRLFIAVWPPVAVTSALAGLPRTDAATLRWTTADQWHITLRYLGDVDESEAREVLDRTPGGAAEAELGPLVQRLAPDTVVVPVRGLDRLAADVWATCPELGERPHPDGFRGHLTLARVRDGGPTSVDGAAISARFPVDEIALVHSDLHADGARYTTVARRMLPS